MKEDAYSHFTISPYDPARERRPRATYNRESMMPGDSCTGKELIPGPGAERRLTLESDSTFQVPLRELAVGR